MTEHTQRCDPISDAVLKIFKRIGEQFEFKEIWNTLPNAERSYLAGDFYNIIQSTSATPAPAACEDNGCTDPEACDEICEHSRIYSPAWVKQHDKEEREKMLKGILMAMNDPQLSICDTGYLEHTYWVDYIKSLRTTKEKPHV